ncbi:MAG: rane-associated protein [Actinoplanes sp.]|jgi:hypothetical protein|nr:rane-associated protein [Actinoplanes sp.]
MLLAGSVQVDVVAVLGPDGGDPVRRGGDLAGGDDAGGLVWGVGSVLLGYLAGNSYAAIEKTFGRVNALLGWAGCPAASGGARSCSG